MAFSQQQPAVRWFDDYRVVLQVGRYLVEEERYEATELLAYFEKPWKWDDAYMRVSARHWAPMVRDNDDRPF